MNRKRVMWIAVTGILVAVVSGFLLLRGLKSFLYPPAPPMPPVVNETTEEILAKLEGTLKRQAPQMLEYLQPGLSGQEIADLERRVGVQLPNDMKALYRWRNGCRQELMKPSGRLSDVPIPGHRFMPLDEALRLPAAISNQLAQATAVQNIAGNVFAGHRESWITLFGDGSGDGYFFDPKREASKGAVFYCFAEDRTYVFFPSIKNLLAGIVKCYESGAFAWKEGALAEDFELSQRTWNEFGASDVR